MHPCCGWGVWAWAAARSASPSMSRATPTVATSPHRACPTTTPALPSTGAGEDHGIDPNQSRLKFPYDSTFVRFHDLHPHPYHLAKLRRPPWR
jgi:hypothetical protein